MMLPRNRVHTDMLHSISGPTAVHSSLGIDPLRAPGDHAKHMTPQIRPSFQKALERRRISYAHFSQL